jgi:hypothetical protein
MTAHDSSARQAGRLTGWRAATVWLVMGVLLVISLACALLIPEQEAMPSWALAVFNSIAASLGIVGALVVTRQPRNAVGWILWASSISVAVSASAASYSNFTVSSAGPVLPTTALIAWVSEIGLTPAITGIIVFIPLLFPDGRLLTRRWRWAAVYGVVVVTLMTIGNMFAPGPLNDYPAIANPFGVPALALLFQPIEFAKGPGVMTAAVLAIASSVVRYRRAAASQRAQLRWFGAAAGLTISLLTLSIVGGAVGLGWISDFGWLGGIVSLSFIPIAIGVAILRYRLYEIDRIISRSLSWAVMSAVLIVVFAVVVVSLQNVLQPLTHENTLAVAASTLVAAALFQPLRRRVQRTVDRRFNRADYDAQRTTDAFGARLRHQTDPGAANEALVETATVAVQPRAAAVWLRVTGS